MADIPHGDTTAQDEAQVAGRDDANELMARASRIRERSQELAEALGPDHPLVTQALERAAYLDAEARRPGHIDLR